MTTITLEVDDELAQRLERQAQKLNLSLPELALLRLRAGEDSADQTVSDEEFEAVARRAIARDAELLRRLAQ